MNAMIFLWLHFCLKLTRNATIVIVIFSSHLKRLQLSKWESGASNEPSGRANEALLHDDHDRWSHTISVSTGESASQIPEQSLFLNRLAVLEVLAGVGAMQAGTWWASNHASKQKFQCCNQTTKRVAFVATWIGDQYVSGCATLRHHLISPTLAFSFGV